jgi:hypothetical protein
VVADPICGVGLDGVTTEVAEPGPAVEEAGMVSDDGGDGVTAGVRRSGKGLGQPG